MSEMPGPVAESDSKEGLDTHVGKAMAGTWLTIIVSFALAFLVFYIIIKVLGGNMADHEQENAEFSKEYERNMEKQQRLEKLNQSWK